MATGQGRGISNQAADPYFGGSGGSAAGSPGSAPKPDSGSFWNISTPSAPSIPNPFDSLAEAFKIEADETRKTLETLAFYSLVGGGLMILGFVAVSAAGAYGTKKAHDSGLLAEAGKAVAKGAKYL